jgi:hypothetical protein
MAGERPETEKNNNSNRGEERETKVTEAGMKETICKTSPVMNHRRAGMSASSGSLRESEVYGLLVDGLGALEWN